MGELSLLESHLNIWIWLSLGLTTLSVGVALICIRTRRSVSRSALLGKIAVMPFSQVQQEMRDELERARRYRRRLAVAVIGLGSKVQKPASWSPKGGEARWGNRERPSPEALRGAFLVLGSVLRDLVRTDDIVAYNASRDQFVLLLVESSRAEATRTLRRVQAQVQERTQIGIHIGVAEFPSDGLILRDLIGHAEQKLSGVSALPSRKTLAQTHA